jgi:hypothetical protein
MKHSYLSRAIRIPTRREYIDRISIKDSEVQKYIRENIANYHYGLSVDNHIFIDGKFVMGIECKGYTENAMVKRILIDFHLLKFGSGIDNCLKQEGAIFFRIRV